jgi:hypothetical protein
VTIDPHAPYRFMPDIVYAGLCGALTTVFTLNVCAALYEWLRALTDNFSALSIFALLDLPLKIIMAGLLTLMHVALGFIAALPVLIGGHYALRALQERGRHQTSLWVLVCAALGLGNGLMLLILTDMGAGGLSDMPRPLAAYSGSGALAALYLRRERRNQAHYNN